MNKIYFSIIFLGLLLSLKGQSKFSFLNKEISKGNYAIASRVIDSLISSSVLTEIEKYDLLFEKDKLKRIRLDFNKKLENILPYIKKYYSDVSDKMIAEWENNNSLEHKIIDGEEWYFARSASNLFRINKEAKAQKIKIDGESKDPKDTFLETFLPDVIKTSELQKEKLIKPVVFHLKYAVTAKPNAVPDGEIIRCWLPYPREGHDRQINIRLNSVNCEDYIIADNKNLQRTLYMEKKTEKNKPTVFSMDLSYTGYSEWYNIDAGKIENYNRQSDLYQSYTAEQPPHIHFSDKIKDISKQVVGNETNPFLKAKLIFEWIDNNFPWAGAREYSTIDNIPEYCLSSGHGDCGIVSLLFITLARYNGIPAKWQSGWMLHPGEVNLHDWAEIYLEGYGWVPVDQSFGLQKSNDEKVRYFFLGGIDSYHMIVNDDYSQPLYPAKIYPRSETVDFQRGELEWRGGNIYFDKWDYDMDVEYTE